MQDEKIVELYWARNEMAIHETEQKYGRYLTKIAYNILSDMEDSKESVNDTYLSAWNTIPPYKPDVLSTYLAKITRRISIDIFRRKTRKKRRPTEYEMSLEELGDCVSAGDTTEAAVDVQLLAEAINEYLRSISAEARRVFIGRYYFMDPLKEVAAYCGMSEGKAKTILYRTRCGLKAYLEEEGLDL